MSFLKESIIDLKAKHKTNGVKIRRLDEAANTKKVYFGQIPGGRAGNKYKSGQIEIPLDQEAYEDAIEDQKIPDMLPNDGDIHGMLQTIAKGKMFVDWDSYGEGVFGMGPDPKELELAVRRELQGGE